MTRVLVIEDNADIAAALVVHLRAAGYHAESAATGGQGLTVMRREPVDVLILDLMLPDVPGEEVLATLRRDGFTTPVLILSAKSDEADKVRGFRLGADDYVTKPFGTLEILARIDNLVRRAAQRPPPEAVTLGSLQIFPLARRVLRDGAEVALRPKELELLLALLDLAGRAIGRRELLERVWQYDATVESRTVDWHVAELRRKLEDDPSHPRFILTVRKVGYRLALPQELDGG